MDDALAEIREKKYNNNNIQFLFLVRTKIIAYNIELKVDLRSTVFPRKPQVIFLTKKKKKKALLYSYLCLDQCVTNKKKLDKSRIRGQKISKFEK